MAATLKFWYDQEGDFLEIQFRQAKGYLREIADDVYERVDEVGNLLGYALFNVSRQEPHTVTIPLEVRQLQSLIQQVA